MRALLAALAFVLVGTACEGRTELNLTVESDGSGSVELAAAVDDDVLDARPDLLADLRVDHLREAGWSVTGPIREADGLTWVRAVHDFDDVDEIEPLVTEAVGADGPFRDVTVSQDRSFAAETYRFSATVNFADGLGAVADPSDASEADADADADADAEADADPDPGPDSEPSSGPTGPTGPTGEPSVPTDGPADPNVDPNADAPDTGLPEDLRDALDQLDDGLTAAIDEVFTVQVAVRLPGDVTSNAPTQADNGAVWRPSVLEPEAVALSATGETRRTIAVVATVLGGVAAVVAVLAAAIWLAGRRRSAA